MCLEQQAQAIEVVIGREFGQGSRVTMGRVTMGRVLMGFTVGHGFVRPSRGFGVKVSSKQALTIQGRL